MANNSVADAAVVPFLSLHPLVCGPLFTRPFVFLRPRRNVGKKGSGVARTGERGREGETDVSGIRVLYYRSGLPTGLPARGTGWRRARRASDEAGYAVHVRKFQGNMFQPG